MADIRNQRFLSCKPITMKNLTQIFCLFQSKVEPYLKIGYADSSITLETSPLYLASPFVLLTSRFMWCFIV